MARCRDLPVDLINWRTDMVKIIHGSGEEPSYRTEKDTSERNITVNGVKTTKSPVSQLPDLDQPVEKRDLIAADILDSLGDRHSERWRQRL